jgi:glucose-1-phosphate thymidylyltransferase
MKGLTQSGSCGTRLRSFTYSQQKQPIPIANKPILFYGIEDLIEAGVKNIGIIVGRNSVQAVETISDIKGDANIKFIEQNIPHCITHIKKISRDVIVSDYFFDRGIKIFKIDSLSEGRNFIIGDNF